MNITPINFKGVTKIIGNRPLSSADRISDLIKHAESGDTKAEEKITKYFNASKTQNQATSITFNNGKTAYVVTGDEYKQIESLYDDMASSVDIASNTYGKGNPMVKLVMESEMDRFTDLAKMIVLKQEDSTFDVSYDDLTNRITSIDLIM